MKKIALLAAALALPLTAAAQSTTYSLNTTSYTVKGAVTCDLAGNTLKPVKVNIKLNQKSFPGMGFDLVTTPDVSGSVTLLNDKFWVGQDDLASEVVFAVEANKKKFRLLQASDEAINRQALASALKLAGYDSSYDTLQIDNNAKVPFQSVLSVSKKGKATLTEKATFTGRVGAGSCNVVFNVARKSSGTLVL